MTDDEFYAARPKLEKIVSDAVEGLEPLSVSVQPGAEGLGYQLSVGGVMSRRIFVGHTNEEAFESRRFTFFDERDLRRIALGLARRRQADLESVVRECRHTIDQTEAGIKAQVEALAKLEGELSR